MPPKPKNKKVKKEVEPEDEFTKMAGQELQA